MDTPGGVLAAGGVGAGRGDEEVEEEELALAMAMAMAGREVLVYTQGDDNSAEMFCGLVWVVVVLREPGRFLARCAFVKRFCLARLFLLSSLL